MKNRNVRKIRPSNPAVERAKLETAGLLALGGINIIPNGCARASFLVRRFSNEIDAEKYDFFAGKISDGPARGLFDNITLCRPGLRPFVISPSRCRYGA